MSNEKPTLSVISGPVEDLTDEKSLAEKHLVNDQHEGPVIVNSRPPQSISDAQMERNGYDPLKFFDGENAKKYVDGVSSRAPSDYSVHAIQQPVNNVALERSEEHQVLTGEKRLARQEEEYEALLERYSKALLDLSDDFSEESDYGQDHGDDDGYSR